MTETATPRLGVVRRVVQASPGRKTRLHTMRGEILPPGAVAELPGLVLARLLGRTPAGPWFCTAAVDFLARILQPHWRVLECGSGRSTLWYAARARSVVALEDEPAWHAEVARMLSGYSNASVELLAARDFPARLGTERPDRFDLVVVDGNEHDEHGGRLPPEADRTACVLAAIPLVRPGGLLILDNSDLPDYRRVDEPLAAWHSTRLRGFPNAPMTPTETTFYWKPPSSAMP